MRAVLGNIGMGSWQYGTDRSVVVQKRTGEHIVYVAPICCVDMLQSFSASEAIFFDRKHMRAQMAQGTAFTNNKEGKRS